MDSAAPLINLACFNLHGIAAQGANGMMGSAGHWKLRERTPANYICLKELTVQFCSDLRNAWTPTGNARPGTTLHPSRSGIPRIDDADYSAGGMGRDRTASQKLGVLQQPGQRFFASLKSRKVTPRIVPHILRECPKIPCSHPCGFLDMGFVEDGGFFHSSKGFFVKRRSREIGKYQDRLARPGGHKFGKRSGNPLNFAGRTV